MLPLDGILVVSCEKAVAAPFATRQLAELGARVIKIERPGGGDFARDYDTTVNGLSSHFVWLNRSKESLTLDLKADGGVVMGKLLARADVFVQNFAPGAAERLGLGADALRGRHPRLITSTTGSAPARAPTWRSACSTRWSSGRVSRCTTPRAAFCGGVLRRPELVADRRFDTGAGRVAHRAELHAEIDAVFGALTGDEVAARLSGARIAHARRREVAEVLDHPQLVARGRWTEVGSPVGPVRALLPPITLPGPRLGWTRSPRSASTPTRSGAGSTSRGRSRTRDVGRRSVGNVEVAGGRAQERLTISPLTSRSITWAAGLAPSPGIVRMSPQIG